jgi:hypothetical protein
MPKQIPQEVKNKAMELFLEGRPAREIAENVTLDYSVLVKPSTIYAWARKYNWGETRAVSRAEAVEQIKETETQRFRRLQEEELNEYGPLRHKAFNDLHVAIKGERTIMSGLVSLQFIQDVMNVLVDEISDSDVLGRVAIKLKALIEPDKE